MTEEELTIQTLRRKMREQLDEIDALKAENDRLFARTLDNEATIRSLEQRLYETVRSLGDAEKAKEAEAH